jgi:Bacterial Ig-like domain (group 2)/CarboxypepD_reg-like domain
MGSRISMLVLIVSLGASCSPSTQAPTATTTPTTPKTPSGTFTGTVLQAGSSQAVASATVTISQADVPLITTTNASGAFAFSGLTDGASTLLQVSAAGYVDSVSTVTIPVNGYTVSLARPGSGAPTLVSLTVTAPATLRIGQTSQLSATTVRSDGATANVTPVATWSSSTPRVAAVSSTGLVTAYSAGQTTITATFREVSGTASISVP